MLNKAGDTGWSEGMKYLGVIDLARSLAQLPASCDDLRHLVSLDLSKLALRNSVSIDDQPLRLVFACVLVEL